MLNEELQRLADLLVSYDMWLTEGDKADDPNFDEERVDWRISIVEQARTVITQFLSPYQE